jgi:hypothetical protein
MSLLYLGLRSSDPTPQRERMLDLAEFNQAAKASNSVGSSEPTVLIAGGEEPEVPIWRPGMLNWLRFRQ